jgi:hypothetical protein
LALTDGRWKYVFPTLDGEEQLCDRSRPWRNNGPGGFRGLPNHPPHDAEFLLRVVHMLQREVGSALRALGSRLVARANAAGVTLAEKRRSTIAQDERRRSETNFDRPPGSRHGASRALSAGKMGSEVTRCTSLMVGWQ